MRIATYNIRYDCKPDQITVQQSIESLPNPSLQPKYLSLTKEQPWSARRLRVADQLLSQNLVIACFQEALIRQVRDLDELLGDEWSWVGVGRDDGSNAGEFCPIFYKRSVIRMTSNDTFWLSNTPFKPSRYPGAGTIRICTVANFTLTSHPSGPKTFTVLNTHLDHYLDDQRKLAASMLLKRARYEAVKTNSPVFITGDFNSPSEGKDSSAYAITTGAAPAVPIDAAFAAKYAVEHNEMHNFKALDLRFETPRKNVSANFATFTDFRSVNDTSRWSRIDFVFGGSNMGWSADRYGVETSLSDDGMLASDHRLVYADITL